MERQDEILEMLADAISDVGVWAWWDTDEDEGTVQVEFAGVQMWNPPREAGQPPSGTVALRFGEVQSAAFLTLDDQVDPDWPRLLHEDKLDGFPLPHESLTFTDAVMIEQLASSAHAVEVLRGVPPEAAAWQSAPWKMGFGAGRVGFVVAARSMELVSFEGSFGLEEVEGKIGKWWEYWEEYWRLIDTPDALPSDYACEVTIPGAPDEGEEE